MIDSFIDSFIEDFPADSNYHHDNQGQSSKVRLISRLVWLLLGEDRRLALHWLVCRTLSNMRCLGVAAWVALKPFQFETLNSLRKLLWFSLH
jgi:hypothetical protein